ncbi:hypothetical protein AAG570_010480 [Ranatra chinensis]|uniref:Uncharacterized protein n=1 Tax=Ranatra chinensis TaxID=642074 RepID=A0ABD0YMP0_9HEMI
MASKRRNMFYENKKQETTEIAFFLRVFQGNYTVRNATYKAQPFKAFPYIMYNKYRTEFYFEKEGKQIGCKRALIPLSMDIFYSGVVSMVETQEDPRRHNHGLLAVQTCILHVALARPGMGPLARQISAYFEHGRPPYGRTSFDPTNVAPRERKVRVDTAMDYYQIGLVFVFNLACILQMTPARHRMGPLAGPYVIVPKQIADCQNKGTNELRVVSSKLSKIGRSTYSYTSDVLLPHGLTDEITGNYTIQNATYKPSSLKAFPTIFYDEYRTDIYFVMKGKRIGCKSIKVVVSVVRRRNSSVDTIMECCHLGIVYTISLAFILQMASGRPIVGPLGGPYLFIPKQVADCTNKGTNELRIVSSKLSKIGRDTYSYTTDVILPYGLTDEITHGTSGPSVPFAKEAGDVGSSRDRGNPPFGANLMRNRTDDSPLNVWGSASASNTSVSCSGPPLSSGMLRMAIIVNPETVRPAPLELPSLEGQLTNTHSQSILKGTSPPTRRYANLANEKYTLNRFLFSCNLQIGIRCAVNGNGGWKENAFNFHFGQACTTAKKIFPEVYELVKKEFGSFEDCPIPPGNYTIRNAIYKPSSLKAFPSILYGQYRTDFYYQKNGKRIGCKRIIFDREEGRKRGESEGVRKRREGDIGEVKLRDLETEELKIGRGNSLPKKVYPDTKEIKTAFVRGLMRVEHKPDAWRQISAPRDQSSHLRLRKTRIATCTMSHWRLGLVYLVSILQMVPAKPTIRPLSGPFLLVPKQVADCANKGTDELRLVSSKLSKIGRDTYSYTSDVLLPYGLSDEISFGIRCASYGNGGWKENAFNFHFGQICTIVKAVFPEIYELIKIHGNVQDCPVPPVRLITLCTSKYPSNSGMSRMAIIVNPETVSKSGVTDPTATAAAVSQALAHEHAVCPADRGGISGIHALLHATI